MPIEHVDAPLGERHPIHNYEYADAAARTAATGFVAGDVGQWAKQLDNGTYWELTDDSPVTWAQRAGAGLTPGAHTHTSADLSDFNSSVDARIKLLQKWALNFTANGDAYIPAYEAMTVDIGVAAIGTGTLAYEKSTTASPGTFTGTSLPATLQAGAWLKVSLSGIAGGFVAVELKRTA